MATKAWKLIQRFIILQGSYLAAVNLLLTTVIKISRTWNLLLPKRQLFVSVGSFWGVIFWKNSLYFRKTVFFITQKLHLTKTGLELFPAFWGKKKKTWKNVEFFLCSNVFRQCFFTWGNFDLLGLFGDI